MGEWFNRLVGFFQKLEVILWAAGWLYLAAAGVLSLVFRELPPEMRANVFLAIAILMGMLPSALVAYALRLRRQRYELWVGVEASKELIQGCLHRDRVWANLQKSCRAVDEYFARMLQRGDLSPSEKRRRCVMAILVQCKDNILPGVDPQHRRLAFLEYSPESQQFEVLADIGLVQESYADVANNLLRDMGLAGAAIRLHNLRYVADVEAPEALGNGYVRIGSQLRHLCLACTGAWVNDRPVGVLSADCMQKDAFVKADFEVLDRFAEKIEWVYSAFPKTG